MKKITSAENLWIKKICKIQKKPSESSFCIVEGKRSLESFIKRKLNCIALYITEDKQEEALKLTQKNKVNVVTTALMKKISATHSPSGLLGVFEKPQQKSLSLLQNGLVLAEINDPGNMGALMRTAAALGTSCVVVINGVYPWSHKVVQASAGTIAYLTIYQLSWNELVDHAKKSSIVLSALIVAGGTSPKNLPTLNRLIIVGNEAHGLSEELIKECDEKITLPMPGGTESLNAAIAGSIALYLTQGKDFL